MVGFFDHDLKPVKVNISLVQLERFYEDEIQKKKKHQSKVEEYTQVKRTVQKHLTRPVYI